MPYTLQLYLPREEFRAPPCTPVGAMALHSAIRDVFRKAININEK